MYRFMKDLTGSGSENPVPTVKDGCNLADEFADFFFLLGGGGGGAKFKILENH